MAGRGRTTFQKRQKEQKRLERRQAKAARKEARKAGIEPESPAGDLVMREDLTIEEAVNEALELGDRDAPRESEEK